MESKAFQSCQGDFRGAFVDLYNNSLTRFEELVFKDMLEQIVNSRKGWLDARYSKFIHSVALSERYSLVISLWFYYIIHFIG